ncbi:hypothetical protein DRN63_02345 [Nanoarchaeota archaeon]|nr:MAG: hypothetical protein DRN63_02345 [Nanoarchaeota archaeon]
MTYCPRCRAELGPNAKFCHTCGTEVRAGIVPHEAKIEERGEVEKNPLRGRSKRSDTASSRSFRRDRT